MTNQSAGGVHRIFVAGGIVLLIVLSGLGLSRLKRVEVLAGGPLDQEKSDSFKEPTLKKAKLPSGIRWHQSYVPVSDRAFHDGGHRLSLDIRLSLRNLSQKNSLYIRQVDLYGTNGKKLKAFAKAPFVVKGFASTEFLVEAGSIEKEALKKAEESKAKEGEGKAKAAEPPAPLSHFVVHWATSANGPEPLIEAEMVDQRGHLSQRREGRQLDSRRVSSVGVVTPSLPRYPEPPVPDAPPPALKSNSQSYELVRPKTSNQLQPKGF